MKGAALWLLPNAPRAPRACLGLPQRKSVWAFPRPWDSMSARPEAVTSHTVQQSGSQAAVRQAEAGSSQREVGAGGAAGLGGPLGVRH